MRREQNIQLFEDKRIRTAWDEEKEEWYFSVADAVSVLTDQPDARQGSTYWLQQVVTDLLKAQSPTQRKNRKTRKRSAPRFSVVQTRCESSLEKRPEGTFSDKLKRAALGGRLFG